MIRMRLIFAVATAVLLGGGLSANAQDSVSVQQYALSHPVDNSELPHLPSLGDSVPQGIVLQKAEGNTTFGYFYWQGEPVLVDLKTRSIVRVGQ